jgi:hypothetical protein
LEPLAPEDVAKEYGLPVHAVLEAIDYCLHHQELLDADRAREAARMKAAGRDQPRLGLVFRRSAEVIGALVGSSSMFCLASAILLTLRLHSKVVIYEALVDS